MTNTAASLSLKLAKFWFWSLLISLAHSFALMEVLPLFGVVKVNVMVTRHWWHIFHMPTNEELFYQGEPESKWEVHGDQWENASTKCIPTKSAVSMTLRLKSYSIRPLNHYACHTISSSGSGLDRTLLIVARKTMKAKAVLTCMAGIISKKNCFQQDFTFIHVQRRLSCNCS